jgi:hypothetical protein
VRVQAGGRLVEEQDRRGGQQAHREVEPAAHAAGVGLGHPVRGIGEVEAREEPLRRFHHVLPGQPVEGPDQLEVLAAGEDLVDRRRLSGEAHAPADLVGLLDDVEAGHPAGAARGHAQRGEHPHQRGLARAVGTEQAQHRPGGDDETHVVHGLGGAEVLDQFDGLDRRGRGHVGRSAIGPAAMCGVMGAACRRLLTGPQENFALGVATRPVAPMGGAGPGSAA